LTYFAFDLLHLDGVDVATMALVERKERLATLLKDAPLGIA
jgi:ATP-dependent DNA ligase